MYVRVDMVVFFYRGEVLEYGSWRPIRIPLLIPCLTWAFDIADWTLKDWQYMVWSTGRPKHIIDLGCDHHVCLAWAKLSIYGTWEIYSHAIIKMALLNLSPEACGIAGLGVLHNIRHLYQDWTFATSVYEKIAMFKVKVYAIFFFFFLK